MLLRRRMFRNSGGSPAYQKIEYLENTSSCFIDTGFSPNQDNFRCVVKVERNNYDIDRYILNVNSSIINLCSIVWRGGNSYWRYKGTSSTESLAPGTYVLELGNPSKINGVEFSINGNKSFIGNTEHLTLFARVNSDNPSGTSFLVGKIYYVQMYYGDTLVMNLVPVRIDTTGYMYDTVSGQLFGNAGTGDFTLGPDITE